MDDEGLEVYATVWPWKFSFVQNFTLNVMNKLVQSNPVTENTEGAIESICNKGAVSRNSAKLGNYKMLVKLRET